MKKNIVAMLAIALLFLSACGGTAGPTAEPTQQPSPEASVTPEPSAAPTATPEPTKAPYTNPLTGEGMDEDISAKRPWAIMINNLDKALPQCGVSQADIIYEVPAEGGVTRMMAIFSDISDVSPIGSMRSILRITRTSDSPMTRSSSTPAAASSRILKCRTFPSIISTACSVPMPTQRSTAIRAVCSTVSSTVCSRPAKN
jgi:hypothetical protein